MPNSRPRRYFALHFLLLRFLGLGWWHNPEERNTENFPGWYIYYSIVTEIVWVAGFVGLETIDPFVGEKDLDRFMFSLSFVITHNLTLIKLYIFFFKNKDIQDIVRILEIDLYDYYQNDEKNRATVKLSRILTGAFLFFGWMTIGNGNVYGTIQDLRWKAIVAHLNDTSLRPVRTLPQPIYIPWNYQNDKSYIPTFVLETIGLLWTGHIVMTIDTFIASVILHMSSQFATLNEAIRTAYDRTMLKLRQGHHDAENFQAEESCSINSEDNNARIVESFLSETEIEKALQTTLTDCFRQHQVLINCVEKFSRTYSYGFMTQLLSSMAAICVVMVQVSQDASSFKSVRLVTSLAFFVAMIIQLAIQCFTGNELTLQVAKKYMGNLIESGYRGLSMDVCNTTGVTLVLLTLKEPYALLEVPLNLVAARAERISDAVMHSKWEYMPVRQRRQLLMMMMRAQRPLRLTAAGFTYMDNACFLSIMKAAYSYYAVLSQKQ